VPYPGRPNRAAGMTPHPETDTDAPSVVRLDDHTIDALAQRVAALIGPSAPTPTPIGAVRGRSQGTLLSAAQVAERFNVDRDWVYAHADELGARRLGTGPSLGCALTRAKSRPTSSPPRDTRRRVLDGNDADRPTGMSDDHHRSRRMPENTSQ
jgi:hypothetical protein